MTTYTIVDKDKDPLGPKEINAGDKISVSDGDVFIVSADANKNIEFETSDGPLTGIEVIFAGSNSNGIDLKFGDDLLVEVTIPDNADLSEVKIDADKADGVSLTAGNNVSFGEYKGSKDGTDILRIGDDFTTQKDWKTSGGDDDVVFGDDATIKDIDTDEGDDTLVFGDDLDADDVKTEKGDDTIRVGKNASVNKIDGGDDTDVMYTETPSTNNEHIETTNIVCFARGTLIETRTGPVQVEDLLAGDLLWTSTRGYQPLKWVGATQITGAQLDREKRLRPIRIRARALGRNLPRRDLIVSPQHRILMRSRIAQRMFGVSEVFITAKKLAGWPGIEVTLPRDGVQYFHLLMDQHDVLTSNGAETESFFLGAQALSALDPADVNEIRSIFPTRILPETTDRLAHPCPQNRMKIKHFLDRHSRNAKPLVTPLGASAWPSLKGEDLATDDTPRAVSFGGQ